MRHLYVVIDMSQAMESQDLKPTRLLSVLKVLDYSTSLFEIKVKTVIVHAKRVYLGTTRLPVFNMHCNSMVHVVAGSHILCAFHLFFIFSSGREQMEMGSQQTTG